MVARVYVVGSCANSTTVKTIIIIYNEVLTLTS